MKRLSALLLFLASLSIAHAAGVCPQVATKCGSTTVNNVTVGGQINLPSGQFLKGFGTGFSFSNGTVNNTGGGGGGGPIPPSAIILGGTGTGFTSISPDTTSICVASGTLQACYAGQIGPAALLAAGAAGSPVSGVLPGGNCILGGTDGKKINCPAGSGGGVAAPTSTASYIGWNGSAFASSNFATDWATQFSSALGTTAGQAYPGNNPSGYVNAAGAAAAAPVQGAGTNCVLQTGRLISCTGTGGGVAAPTSVASYIGWDGTAFSTAATPVALSTVPGASFTNLNTSTYNPSSLTPASYSLASTNADALGMNFMQFPGAHMDGVGNDCPAWNEAMAAVNQQWNQYHLATPIIFPPGHGRVYLNCTSVTQPAQGVPAMLIGTGGHNATVIQLGAAFNGNLITWSNVNIGSWPNIPGTVPWNTGTSAGARVVGVTCAGVRPTQTDPRQANTLPAASSVIQNCFDSRDNNKQLYFSDVDCYELPGSCLRTGYTLNNPITTTQGALTDETDVHALRAIEVGLTAAASPDGLSHPPLDMNTTGGGDAFNQIFFDKVRITRAYSECGYWEHNQNNQATGARQVHAIAMDIEDTFGASLGGAGFCFGSPTDTGPVTFACDQCVSLGAAPGGSGVLITGPPGLTSPNQSQGIDFTNFTVQQTNEGPNVDVENGYLHHFDFQKFVETQWTPWASGATVPAGGADVSQGIDGYIYTNTSNPANSCVIGSTPPSGRGTGSDGGACSWKWVSPTCSVCAGVTYPQWGNSTAYVAGNKTADNAYIWLETAATCTSAASGNGPTTGSTASDNTCSWTNQGKISISATASSVFTTNGNDPGMGLIYIAPGLPATIFKAPYLINLVDSVAGATIGTTAGSATITPGGPGTLSNPLALSAWNYLQKIDGRNDCVDMQSSSDSGSTFHDGVTICLSGTAEGTLGITDVVRGLNLLSFNAAGTAALLGETVSGNVSIGGNESVTGTDTVTAAIINTNLANGGVGYAFLKSGANGILQGASTQAQTSGVLDLADATPAIGDTLQRSGTVWSAVPTGTAGQVWTSQGPGLLNGWATPASSTQVYPSAGIALSSGTAWGTSLAHVANTLYTPTLNLDTCGTCTVAYTTQSGKWVQIGSIVFVHGTINGTITTGTGTGNVQVSLPAGVGTGNAGPLNVAATGSFAWPGSAPTQLNMVTVGGASYANLTGNKTSGVTTTMGVSNVCATSCAIIINFQGSYDTGSGS